MEMEPGLRRLIAPNPSPMTERGTNTYLIGCARVAVIDPGPDDADHRQAILGALGEAAAVAILVTHAHRDHSEGAAALADATGAPVLAADRRAAPSPAAVGQVGGGEGVDATFAPHRTLTEGAVVDTDAGALAALATPGHMAGHLAFAWGGALFTGDAVMGWAPSLVSPPDGDMTAYMATLARLAARPWRIFYPGHGAPVADPASRLAALTAHRRDREAAIRAALAAGARTIPKIVARVYADTPQAFHPAAARNVLAHLLDLSHRGEVRAAPAPTPDADWHLT